MPRVYDVPETTDEQRRRLRAEKRRKMMEEQATSPPPEETAVVDESTDDETTDGVIDSQGLATDGDEGETPEEVTDTPTKSEPPAESSDESQEPPEPPEAPNPHMQEVTADTPPEPVIPKPSQVRIKRNALLLCLKAFLSGNGYAEEGHLAAKKHSENTVVLALPLGDGRGHIRKIVEIPEFFVMKATTLKE